MPQLFKTLSLFPGEPKAPAKPSAVTRQPTQTWIAICLDAALPNASLKSLAIWARTLTPAISIVEPNVLLLEVHGSLKLFGGIEKIKHALKTQLARRHFSAELSVAPTANAAVWLSRQTSIDVFDYQSLTNRLRSLPLYVTQWPEAVLMRLSEMGLKSVGDLLRLPRDGFAKRIGTHCLRDLDRALGKEFDSRSVIKLPETLSWLIDLPQETNNISLLLEAAEILLDRMMSDLRKQQKQMGNFEFHFSHLHREPSIESFELLEPSYQKQRLFDLFSVRIERLYLPAPVIALELKTNDLRDLHIDPPEMFGQGVKSGRGMDIAMLERLQERFGPKSIYWMDLAADHRPECAWLPCSNGANEHSKCSEQVSPWAGERPLWLLQVPLRCDVQALHMEPGPERIESGWWDLNGINRDYYVAYRPSGEKLWVYFDSVGKQWYLHGIFG